MDEKLWTAEFQETLSNGNELLDGPSSTLNLISQLKQEENCDVGSQLQENVEAVICETEKYKIQKILDEVNTLKPIEKLLLYLKLPTESSNNVDPLRQPLNPLGSRTEISQTIIWIRTHLEQDQDISLQKKAVYDEYQSFCDSKKIKPLSTADFGKVMKQVYPMVKPRRLGVRGQSQYCYSGLRKRVRLNMPLLPDLSQSEVSYESDLTSAAWSILREWCGMNFKKQFHSLPALAYYLVITFSICSGSSAANTITNAFKYQEDGGIVQNPFVDKHRETTMLLQRKLQEKCEVKEQKRKNQPGRPRSRSSSKCKRSCKGSKSESASPVKSLSLVTSPAPPSAPTGGAGGAEAAALPEFSSLRHAMADQAQEVSPDPDPRTAAGAHGEHMSNADDNSDTKKNKPTKKHTDDIPNPSSSSSKPPPSSHPNRKYKSIQPKPTLSHHSSSSSTSTSALGASDSAVTHRRYQRRRHNQMPAQLQTLQQQLQVQAHLQQLVQHKREPSLVLEEHEQNVLLSRERLNSISTVPKEDLDDYLMGASNSQEQSEEEIMSYFENNNEAPSTKVQQLRQFLIHSKFNELQQPTDNNNTGSYLSILHTNNKHRNNNNNNSRVYPTLMNPTRRRVSFDTQTHSDNHLIHQHSSLSVPPSPNTRRRNFNFTPIGVAAVGGGGVGGDAGSPPGTPSMSAGASPFVSPRETPAPRARGHSYPHVQPYQQQQLQQQQQVQQMSAPTSPKGGSYATANYKIYQQDDDQQDLFSDNLVLRSKSVPVPYYAPMPAAPGNYAAVDSFASVSEQQQQQQLQPPSKLYDTLQLLDAQQHLDSNLLKFRSVPSTPVSLGDLGASSSCFTYSNDYLLNGQRVKANVTKGSTYNKGFLFGNTGGTTTTTAAAVSGTSEDHVGGTSADHFLSQLSFDEATEDPNHLNY